MTTNCNNRRGPSRQARHQTPGAAGAVWHLCGSGADGQSAFSDRDASHGRPRGEIHWARRRGARCGSGAQGGSPRGAQCPRCCEAAFGIARQGDADRPARRIGGHFGRCPRSAESRRRRFGVAARRLRKRQEPLPLGVWRRKSSARHPGRTGSDLGGAALIQAATRNSSEG